MGCSAGPSVASAPALYLDAGNAKSYPGSGTTWTDLSGNGNHGTLVNVPTYSSASVGSIVFDGVNDYVNAPVTKTASVTFSCWAKTQANLITPMLFNAGPNLVGPDLVFYAGMVSWNIWDGASNTFGQIPASASNGMWHHYAIVNDATSTAKLYYDNILYGSAAYRNASVYNNLTIGGNVSDYMWNGSISGFSVYNRALSAAEVQQNFNALRGRYGV